jgi:hypothetical protein
MPLISTLGVMNATGFGFASTKQKPSIVFSVPTVSPYVFAMPFSSSTGFGGLYANPVTVPSSASGKVIFNSTSTVVVAAPSPSAYAWSNGFSTKYADPAFGMTGISFNTAGTRMAGSGGSTYLQNYQWSNTSGFGTRNEYTSGQFTNIVYDTFINTSDTAIGVVSRSNGYLNALAWTNASGFGSKYAAPATPPAGIGVTGCFNYSGTVVAMTCNGTPGINVYAWTDAAGFGTRYTDPSPLPSGTVGKNLILFNAQGTVIAISNNTTPYISCYAWTNASGFGSKYADPSSAFSSTGLILFTKLGDAVVTTRTSAPYVEGYMWTNASGFGTKFTNPTSISGAVSGITYSN